MSSDDNKPNSDDHNESPRQSPVIARDVAADPSKANKDVDVSGKPKEETAASSDATSKSAAIKDGVIKTSSTLTDKLKTSKLSDLLEPADPIVTQQGVPTQDDSEDEDKEDLGGGALDDSAESPGEQDDLGDFLEEIFPDGDLPEFAMPGRVPASEEDDTAQETAPAADEIAIADESSTEVRGSEAQHDDVPQNLDDDPDESEEEEAQQDEPDAPAERAEDDEELPAPTRDDFFEETDPSEALESSEEVSEISEVDVVPASIFSEPEVRNVPLPAITLSPEASKAAPLDTDGLPVDESDVRGLLEQIGGLARSCNMTSLSNEIHQERLPTLAGGRVTLVVLGEFNHGKSTVINALLGDEVLPMGITPTTAVITHLVHAEKPVVTIQPAHHGTPYTIAYDKMEQAVKESGAEGEEPEYVEIGFPNDVLKNSLVLVDTPGVNDISRQKVEITYGYLPRADVILYVLDATQVLKKSEVTFIKDRLLKSSSDRIIFVLNKIDALSPDDIEEVVEYARERLTAILGPVELFTFSGRKALQAQLSGSALPVEFTNFQSYLQRFLQEQRAFIILDSALASGLRVSTMMEQNLAIKRQGYRLERSELAERIAAVRSRLKESRRLIAENTQLIDSRVQGIAATAKHNLRIFTEQFSEQLPLQIERADASDVKKFLPTWIQETYKQWLEDEGSSLARSLEELAEEIIQITNESLQQTLQSYQKEFGLTDELDLNIDTVAYDVGVFALGAFGVSIFLFANIIVGSLLTLATPVLAYFFKEKLETRVKERAREQGAEAITAASAKLEEELLRVIHGYGDRLKEFVEMAGDRLYRQIEEALQQVQQETSGDYDREELLATVTTHLKSIKLIQDEITSSREKLEAWATSQDFG